MIEDLPLRLPTTHQSTQVPAPQKPVTRPVLTLKKAKPQAGKKPKRHGR